MAHNLSTGSEGTGSAGGGQQGATRGSEAVLAMVLWVLVTIALTYGVWQTVTRAARLFTA
ncbi:MAG: hypothetical protein M3Q22_11810 [Actinomycetota bacterium]|nr:hypothetical protein [Actinomycetota bacterium]MDP9460888.1 hypothetical protein [Actinomycetota bacterium]